jgi:ABC-type molybdate transport system substrate-binding protein
MRIFGRMLTFALTLFGFITVLQAAEIRVLSVGEVAEPARILADAFGRESGHRVVFTFASPADVVEKIKAGEIHDAVILSEPAMDRLDRDGIVNPESRVPLARAEATVFEGALMSEGEVPEAARAFIRFLAGEEAREHWLAARLEPLP